MLFNKDYDYSLIQTSSKEALLRSALLACNNDLKSASEICEYFISKLPSMPEREPEPPSVFNQLDGIDSWLSAWGEKHSNITNGVGNMLMTILKNSRFGSLLQPVEEVITTAKDVPAAPIV